MSTRSTAPPIRRTPTIRRPLRPGDALVAALLLLPVVTFPLAALRPAPPTQADAAPPAIALRSGPTATTAAELQTRRRAIEQRLQTLSDVERMGGVQTELIAELREIVALESLPTTP